MDTDASWIHCSHGARNISRNNLTNIYRHVNSVATNLPDDFMDEL